MTIKVLENYLVAPRMRTGTVAPIPTDNKYDPPRTKTELQSMMQSQKYSYFSFNPILFKNTFHDEMHCHRQ